MPIFEDKDQYKRSASLFIRDSDPHLLEQMIERDNLHPKSNSFYN